MQQYTSCFRHFTVDLGHHHHICFFHKILKKTHTYIKNVVFLYCEVNLHDGFCSIYWNAYFSDQTYFCRMCARASTKNKKEIKERMRWRESGKKLVKLQPNKTKSTLQKYSVANYAFYRVVSSCWQLFYEFGFFFGSFIRRLSSLLLNVCFLKTAHQFNVLTFMFALYAWPLCSFGFGFLFFWNICFFILQIYVRIAHFMFSSY